MCSPISGSDYGASAVLLIGLVTKNDILLVDFANVRYRAGLDHVAATERFRPIIMTTVSMIAGMIPLEPIPLETRSSDPGPLAWGPSASEPGSALAFVLDPGAQAARSLGTVVIGGLASSLLLTLLLVPVVFVAMTPERYVGHHENGTAPLPAVTEPPLPV